MDFLTVIGILVAFGAIILGQQLEGGSITSLLDMPAFIIVVGTVIGIVILETPRKELCKSIKLLHWLIKPPVYNFKQAADKIILYANQARAEGLLAIEKQAALEEDKFIAKGLQMVVDGKNADYIAQSLEVDLISEENSNMQSAQLYENMGGYAPTIGIVGALIGLIHVLNNISVPEMLAEGISVAFVATMYGVVFANLLFIPVYNKLKKIIQRKTIYQEMLLSGLVLLADNENPKLIEDHLAGFIEHYA